MNKRIGVVGIVIQNRIQNAPAVNDILSEFGDIIVGRLGVPRQKHDLSVISLIVEGTPDQLGALTGRLGSLADVDVKSGLTSTEIPTQRRDNNVSTD